VGGPCSWVRARTAPSSPPPTAPARSTVLSGARGCLCAGVCARIFVAHRADEALGLDVDAGGDGLEQRGLEEVGERGGVVHRHRRVLQLVVCRDVCAWGVPARSGAPYAGARPPPLSLSHSVCVCVCARAYFRARVCLSLCGVVVSAARAAHKSGRCRRGSPRARRRRRRPRPGRAGAGGGRGARAGASHPADKAPRP
jgi:hypothetical protein